ncbi:MAG: hypothetical protein R3C59_00605 [Planctomycetaceae bacterium]
MFVLLILVVVYKLLTIRMIGRSHACGRAMAALNLQVALIRAQNPGDILAAQQQINTLYQQHGVQAGDITRLALVDFSMFVVWLVFFDPTTRTRGDGFLWVADISVFQGSILPLWIAVSTANTRVRKSGLKPMSFDQVLTGGLVVLGITYGVARFWSWPAHVFVFWILVTTFNLVCFTVLRLADAAKAHSPTQPAPQVPSPQAPAQPQNRPGTNRKPQPPQRRKPPAPSPAGQRPAARNPGAAPNPGGRNAPTAPGTPCVVWPPATLVAAGIPRDQPGRNAPPDLQTLIDATAAGATLKLQPAGSWLKGPATLRRAICIDGSDCTVWSKQGPALVVVADGVQISNLNIEVTDTDERISEQAATALLTKCATPPMLQRCAVRGGIAGRQGGLWKYPRQIRTGTLKPGSMHQLKLRIEVGEPCRIESNVTGIKCEPSTLTAGSQELTLAIDALSADTRLRGYLTLQSAGISHRIQFAATAGSTSRDGKTLNGQMYYQSPTWNNAPPKPQVPKPHVPRPQTPKPQTTKPPAPVVPAPPVRKPQPPPQLAAKPAPQPDPPAQLRQRVPAQPPPSSPQPATPPQQPPSQQQSPVPAPLVPDSPLPSAVDSPADGTNTNAVEPDRKPKKKIKPKSAQQKKKPPRSRTKSDDLPGLFSDDSQD